jgi:hypothetical protein
MAEYMVFTATRVRLSAGVLIAAAGVILAPMTATGSTAVAIKINTKTHTVTTGKFVVQFGNSTTNPPNDPERIDSLTWKNSSGTVSGNLAVRGGSVPCNADAQEYWGQSYASTEGQAPGLVVGGSVGTWKSPAAGQVVIKTDTTTTCGTHIPVTTTYTFFGTGAHANEIKFVRKVPFATHPFANPSDEGLRIYVPRLSFSTYSQVLYPDSHQKLVVGGLCDNCLPLGSSAWGGRWFADNNPADNSGLLVLRAATDQPGAELEIDIDDLSGSNNTAIDLPQPAGGWTASITETEYLCFYDATSWPLSHRQPGKAVTLPAGCGG